MDTDFVGTGAGWVEKAARLEVPTHPFASALHWAGQEALGIDFIVITHRELNIRMEVKLFWFRCFFNTPPLSSPPSPATSASESLLQNQEELLTSDFLPLN